MNNKQSKEHNDDIIIKMLKDLPISTTMLHLQNMHYICDLSILQLKQYALYTFKEIIISNSKIKEILHLPDSLIELSCINNALCIFPILPKNIEIVNISYNNVSRIIFDVQCTCLSELHVQNNHITMIENIPKSITIINMENNKVKELSLENLQHLLSINCINNISIILCKVPHCTKVHISSYTIDNNDNNENIDTTNINNNIPYKNALYYYYKLQNDYIQYCRKNNTTICINCRQPGTMSFIKINNIYSAVCNCTVSCFHIIIDNCCTINQNIEENYYRLKKENHKLENDIILLKLQHLYQYISHEMSIQLFHTINEKYQKNIQEFTECSKQLNTMMDKKNKIYDVTTDNNNTILSTLHISYYPFTDKYTDKIPIVIKFIYDKKNHNNSILLY
jgi:hypothetical protein